MNTATAQHADLVLPTTLPFERNDIVAARRDDWLVLSRKVLAPPEGCLNDYDWFTRLAGEFGVEDAFTEGRNEWPWLSHIYASYCQSFPELPDWTTFCETGFARLSDTEKDFDATPLQGFVANPDQVRLDTATGRIDLAPDLIFKTDCRLGHALSEPVAADHCEDGRFPLRLLSPQPEPRLHSQMETATAAQAMKQNGYECARANPADIAAANLKPNDLAEIWNNRGIAIAAILADPRVARGHIVLPTGSWYKPIRDQAGRIIDFGGNPNTLTRDTGTSSMAQGASAGVSRVALRPIQASLKEIV